MLCLLLLRVVYHAYALAFTLSTLAFAAFATTAALAALGCLFLSLLWFLSIAAVIAAVPGLAMASDWGRPGEWVAGLYLFVAVPFTAASVLGMIAGGSFGWYRDKDAAVAHASIATLLYGCGIPVALFATKSWLGTVVWLVLLGLLSYLALQRPPGSAPPALSG